MLAGVQQGGVILGCAEQLLNVVERRDAFFVGQVLDREAALVEIGEQAAAARTTGISQRVAHGF